jgi:hypothetical protein
MASVFTPPTTAPAPRSRPTSPTTSSRLVGIVGTVYQTRPHSTKKKPKTFQPPASPVGRQPGGKVGGSGN